MPRSLHIAMLCGLAFVPAFAAHAQEIEEKEKGEGVVVEMGPTNEWVVRGGSSANAGAAVGVEVPVIEDWLEIELAGAALGTSGHTELSGALILKKPFRLSQTTEFMIGAGPKYAKTLSGPDQGTASGAEVDVDFMFWPRQDLGWYIQPDWSVVSKTGEQSVGITVGVLIRVP